MPSRPGSPGSCGTCAAPGRRARAVSARSRSGSAISRACWISAGIGVAVCTDGIGTKALIAQMMGRYDTVGIDCVAMNVNDLVCVGAQPITLVDYIAVEHAEPAMLEALGAGLAEGARRAWRLHRGRRDRRDARRDQGRGAGRGLRPGGDGRRPGRTRRGQCRRRGAAGGQHRRHREQRHPQQRTDPRPAGLLRKRGPQRGGPRRRARRDRGRGAAPPHPHLRPRGVGPAGERGAGACALPHHRRRLPQPDPYRG